MPIEAVPPLELDTADIAQWSMLQGDGDTASPFLSPWWPQALARVGGPDAAKTRVAILREDGRAKAFIALRTGPGAALPAGAPLSDYQGVVAAPGARLETRPLLEALAAHRLDFCSAIDSCPTLGPHGRGGAVSHVIDLRDGYDRYVLGRTQAGSDILKDCAKKRRKMEREIGPVRFTAESGQIADFDRLVAWKRAQYGETRQTDILGAGWPADLLRRLLAGPEGAMRGILFTLHAGDRLAAAHYALCTPKVAHAWFIAHDDDLGRYSPGVVLITEVIRWAADTGRLELDLGTGDYRFKLSLANRSRAVRHGFVGRPSFAAAIRGAEYSLRSAAESLPLGRLSQVPAKAMRRRDRWRGLGGFGPTV